MRLLTNLFHKLVLLATALIAIAALCINVPKYFGYIPYIVLSGSMEPTIETGSIVYVDTHDTNFNVGDVVTYRIAAGTDMENRVTHRVIEIDENGYAITKGDANDNPDMNPVPPSDIVGKFYLAVPKVGYVMAKIDSKTRWIIFGWVAALNIIAAYLATLFDEDAEEKKKENEAESEGQPS